MLSDKDVEITELKETVEIMTMKIQKLEQLLQLKEHKIDALNYKVEALTSGNPPPLDDGDYSPY